MMTIGRGLLLPFLPAIAWLAIVPGPARSQSSESFDAANLIVTIGGQIGQAPAFGAGIIFGREQDALYVATANHVVRSGKMEATAIEVRLKTSPDRGIKAKLLPQFDGALDVAVIRVEGLAANGVGVCALRIDHLSNSAPKRGDDVYAVGNPNGVGWAIPVRPDKVSDTSGDNIVFESVLIARGHSGGGLFNGRGQLIGMVQADQPPYGRAIDVRKVLAILKQWNYPVHLRTQTMVTEGHYETKTAKYYDGPPLFGAVWHRDFEDAKVLLGQACTDVNAKDRDENTALHAAESLELARLLLDAGADPNAINKSGQTPLYLAARRGNADVVYLLLTRGANPNLKGSDALSEACDWGDLEMIRRLLASGADVNLRSRGRTPLVFAVNARGFGSDFWDDTVDPEATRNAKSEAQQKNDGPQVTLAMVKLLIAAGADVNARDNAGHTPIFYAVFERYSPSRRISDEVLETLIRAGARVDVETTSMAVLQKDEPALIILLAAGGDVNFTPEGKKSLLDDLFVRHEPPARQLAARLLAAGAKPDREGASQLLKATEWGWTEVAAGLINAGVDPNGKEPGTLLRTAIIYGRSEIFRMLLEAGANPNAPGSPYTLLQIALLPQGGAAGVDLDASTRFGFVAMLVEKHARVTVGGRDVQAEPLYLALAGDLPPDLKSAALLIAHGANVNAVDTFGDSLLDKAISQNRPGVVDLLVKAGAKRARRSK